MAVLLAMVTYLDRACIATLGPGIQADLGLSKDQMSVVYSAFALAYALFEIPTAWWADRRGTRHVLTRIVLWWSAFTMLTAATWNYVVLVVTRFLFGAREAGAWPSAARTFSRWVPRAERGTIQGIFFSGAHLAGGLTPMLVVWRGDGPRHQTLRIARGPVRRGCGSLRAGWRLHDFGDRGAAADAGGDADRGGRRGEHVHARFVVEPVSRHRRQPRGRGQRGDEHLRRVEFGDQPADGDVAAEAL
jgi:MFS family permease